MKNECEITPPNFDRLREMVIRVLQDDPSLAPEWIGVISIVFANAPIPQLEQAIRRARSAAIFARSGIAEELLMASLTCLSGLPRGTRMTIAQELINAPLVSRQQISELTGISTAALQRLSKSSFPHAAKA